MEGDVLQQGVTRHAALIARLGDAVCLVAAGQQSHTVAQWSFLSSWWRCVVWTLKDVGTHARNDRAAGAANKHVKERNHKAQTTSAKWHRTFGDASPGTSASTVMSVLYRFISHFYFYKLVASTGLQAAPRARHRLGSLQLISITTAPLVAAPLLHAQWPAPHLVAAAAAVRHCPSAGRLLHSVFQRGMATNQALLLHAGVLGSGLLSGLYFIFSFCVMPSLNAQPPASAITTMNTINTIIVNPPFMLFFMGTPLACAALLWSCLKEGIGTSLDNKLMTAGALTLLLGEFMLTLLIHIPKNDALAAYVAGSVSDASTWAEYYSSWTAWNHVRMLASILTVVQLASALELRAARLAVLHPIQM